MRSKTADLLIETRNAVGTLGVALPLDIRLVRVRNVSIETIRVLGLPRGVTISDLSNTFASSGDNTDVDVSAWDLSKIQITQTDPHARSFSLAVAAIWAPETGGHIDVTASRLTVDLAPVQRDRVAAAPDPETVAGRVDAAAPSAAPLSSVPLSPAPLSPAPAPPAAATAPAAPPESTAALARPSAPARPSPGADPLVERANGLIRLGDISGARLLLERAQARNAANATFLLAQTWDPAMHRSWKVRGLRSDADLARSLYARAADQDRTEDRRLAATGR